MNKEHYHHLLSSTVENALLHLYCHVSSSTRMIPTPKRNLVLCKYLKPKIKHPKYKIIKNELKRMVFAGQQPNGNLEAKLNELHQVALYHQAKTHNAQHLYDLLNTLYDKHCIDSRLFDPNDPSLPDVIYILQEHLEHCFESHGRQVAPISLLIELQEMTPDTLMEYIQCYSSFTVELKEFNEPQQQAHLLLHP
ncbi:DUF2913 family protein (plasmid) [Photobacterium damselae subsp. damselae]